MELNWSTFILEIINFLILVWILKRFLYKPVLNIIAQRQAGIEKTLAEARTLHNDAETLQQQYQRRLSDWEQERRQALDALNQEIDQARLEGMTRVQTELEQERQKTRVIEQHKLQDSLDKIEEMALVQAADFASRILSQSSGPELESRLIDLALSELTKLSEKRIQSLKAMWTKPPDEIVIDSAYALSDKQQQQLEQTLLTVTDLSIPIRFNLDPELIAGLQITVGPWVLHFNLRDELKSFAGFAHGAR